MSKRTVDLGFRRAPLVVQQTLVAWTILGFGAHALLGEDMCKVMYIRPIGGCTIAD